MWKLENQFVEKEYTENEFEDLGIIFFSDQQVDEEVKKFFYFQLKEETLDYTSLLKYADLAVKAKDICFWLSQIIRQVNEWRFFSKFLFYELEKIANLTNQIKFDFENSKELEFFDLILSWINYYLQILIKNPETKDIILDWQNKNNHKKN